MLVEEQVNECIVDILKFGNLNSEVWKLVTILLAELDKVLTERIE